MPTQVSTKPVNVQVLPTTAKSPGDAAEALLRVSSLDRISPGRYRGTEKLYFVLN